MDNKECKLWAGQLYLSHTSEIVAKLLYKKFYRNTDTTILYGKWATILREQHRMYLENSGLDDDTEPRSLGHSAELNTKHSRRHSPNDSLEEVATLYRNLNRLSDPSPSPSDPPPKLNGTSDTLVLRNPSNDSLDLPYILVSSPVILPTSPQRPSLGKKSGLETKRNRSAVLFSRFNPLLPAYKRNTVDPDTSIADGSSYCVASSRDGILSPRELEPFQCCILFYSSCSSIPSREANQLKKVFGPELAPQIEAYIRDKLNGEQSPGTAFMMETGSHPCRYIVCTCVARHNSLLSPDYAYNAFRAALQAIYLFNKTHDDNQITSVLCPVLESVTASPYNMVQQLETCYEYWDWRVYEPGAVLPLANSNKDAILHEIQMVAPSIPKIAEDLEQYVWAGLLVPRGLVYEIELKILTWWMSKTNKPTSKKLPGVQRSSLPKHLIAQMIVDIIKKSDTPPFTLTPVQIYAGIPHKALEYIMELAVAGQIKIYEEILTNELKIIRTIAHGNSGKVAHAEWEDRPVAVKFFNVYDPQVFRNELTLITLAHHPKLVQAYGGYCSEKATYIVTELMEVNLYQFLLKHKNLEFVQKLKIARDVAEAMEFLHSRGIIHRDLKSVNVLINSGPDLVAKVCDFGLSRVMDDTCTMTGNIGTVAWIAPEIFQNKKYTERCDVYSFGVLMFELLTHMLPFKEFPNFKIPQVVTKGQRPVIPSEIAASAPKEFMVLMKQCWHENANKRPSFSNILLRINAMLPTEKIGTSFNSTLTEDDAYDSSDSELEEFTSSSSSFSFADQEQPLIDELKTALGSRRHSKLVTRELLAKSLIVRKGKIPQAKKLVKNYLEWYQILSHGRPIRVSDVRKTLEQKVLFLQSGATDKDGRTIIYWDAAKYNVEAIPEPDLIRALVYCLERATERADLHAKGIVIIGNMTKFSISNFSTRVMNSFFGTLRKYFPVIIHRMFFVNSPPWISRMIAMGQSFVRSIMSVAEITDLQKLRDHISPDNLLPVLNGSFDFDIDSWIRIRYEIEGIEYL